MNKEQILYFLSIVFLVGVTTLTSFLVIKDFERGQNLKDNNCPYIFTEIPAIDFSWSSNKNELLILQDKQIKKVKIENCRINSEKVLDIKSADNILLCKNAEHFLSHEGENTSIRFLSSESPKNINLYASYKPVYCDTRYIILTEILPEPTLTYYLYEINTSYLQTISETELVYTVVPISLDEFIYYKENDRSGIYKNNDLILPVENFGFWDLSSSKKHIYYTKPEEGKTKILRRTTDSHLNSTLIKTVDFSIKEQILTSKSEEWLATKDLSGELVLFYLK